MAKMSKKQAILELATVLFADKGFTKTSMTEVAKLAGIAGATIFYHYKTKEELFVAVIESVKVGVLQEYCASFKDCNEKFPNGLEMLLAAVSFHLHLADSKKQWFLLLRHHFTHELAAVNRDCRRHLAEIYECLIKIFEKALAMGIEDGSVRQLSPRKTALIILAMVDGIEQLENNRLYDASALYGELLVSCRHMIQQ
ncbi:MAG: TetR/AcrR family transcriptional regulator [Desulforhopalus sp.]|jgi:AcrR family transcriptional regulator|nr:TetR/AcrR family transcriptional regulator [Desulforhopalus sp.]